MFYKINFTSDIGVSTEVGRSSLHKQVKLGLDLRFVAYDPIQTCLLVSHRLEVQKNRSDK